MYFKENWQSMAEKKPALGHVTMFQTSPSPNFFLFPPSGVATAGRNVIV